MRNREADSLSCFRSYLIKGGAQCAFYTGFIYVITHQVWLKGKHRNSQTNGHCSSRSMPETHFVILGMRREQVAASRMGILAIGMGILARFKVLEHVMCEFPCVMFNCQREL